jgi:hypothetical protein
LTRVMPLQPEITLLSESDESEGNESQQQIWLTTCAEIPCRQQSLLYGTVGCRAMSNSAGEAGRQMESPHSRRESNAEDPL